WIEWLAALARILPNRLARLRWRRRLCATESAVAAQVRHVLEDLLHLLLHNLLSLGLVLRQGVLLRDAKLQLALDVAALDQLESVRDGRVMVGQTTTRSHAERALSHGKSARSAESALATEAAAHPSLPPAETARSS